MNKQEVLILLAALLCCVVAITDEERWVWSKRNTNDQSNDKSAKYQSTALRRNAKAREREPTTRRPIPGQPQNDEIDDYGDEEEKPNVGTRNFPFPPYNGGGLYPNIGGVGGLAGNGNGILVGPGGPTGVIGRPQTQYPGGFPSTGFLGQPGLGFPAIQGAFGGGNGLGNGGQFGVGGGGGYFGTDGGSNPAFGGQFGGVGQFGGSPYPGSSQYPTGGQYPGGAQYPVGQFPGSQYPAQYPGGRPLYTEGYGLASTGAGYPGYIQGPAQFGYPSTFNVNDIANRKLSAEGKDTVVVESSSKLRDQRLDDKINKSFTKLPN